MENTFNLTENAIQAINKHMEENNIELDKRILRIGVRGGSCNGYTYVLDMGNTKKNYDKILEFNNFKVFIDPKSLTILKNTLLDYKTGLLERGYVFLNDQHQKCGCEKSFSI